MDKRERDDNSIVDKFSQIIGSSKADPIKTMNTQGSIKDLADYRASIKGLVPLAASLAVPEANPVEQDMVEQDLKNQEQLQMTLDEAIA